MNFAQILLGVCVWCVCTLYLQQEEMLTQLEEAIRETEEAALDAADTDSIMTGTSFTGNQDGKRYGHWLR